MKNNKKRLCLFVCGTGIKPRASTPELHPISQEFVLGSNVGSRIQESLSISRKHRMQMN
jgi:hypothetical protein